MIAYVQRMPIYLLQCSVNLSIHIIITYIFTLFTIDLCNSNKKIFSLKSNRSETDTDDTGGQNLRRLKPVDRNINIFVCHDDRGISRDVCARTQNTYTDSRKLYQHCTGEDDKISLIAHIE